MNRNLTNRKNDNSLNPWSSFRDEMMNFFDRFSDVSPFQDNQSFLPKIEVQDKGSDYLVCAEIPGMSEKDINITFDNNQLILEGEKKHEKKDEKEGYYHSEFSYGKFYRAIPLGEDVDEDKVSADYKDGILQVTLGKRPDTQKKSKKIPIGSSSKSEGKSESAKH
jgi:HSP20 family protein